MGHLLFSAKEATYKAWYPLTGIVLSHAEVDVELSPTGTFTGCAAAHDSAGREVVHRVRGRWGLGPPGARGARRRRADLGRG